MLFEGDTEVLTRLFQKKRLLAAQNPRHEEVRPALLVLSGVMRGVYGGGQVTALERFGLCDVFDVVAGISTGAPAAGYFLAGQAALGTTIYSEECTTPEFISLPRVFSSGKPAMDTEYLMDVFRGVRSDKKLNQERIRLSRSRLYVGVACAKTGRGKFLDAKTVQPDIVEAIHASLVAPGISRGSVVLGKNLWTDGAVSLAFPAQKLLKEFQPTDLLILANRENVCRKTFSLERVVSPLLFSGFPTPVRQAFNRRDEGVVRELALLRAQKKVRAAIIWTDGKIGRFERSPKKLKSAAQAAETHLTKLLTEAERSTNFLGN